MLSESVVRDYYLSADIVLPGDSNWRQYKVMMVDRRWFNVKKKIKDWDDLKRELLRMEGCLEGFSIGRIFSIYHTVSSYLDPLSIHKKDGYRVAHSRVVVSRVPFEVDTSLHLKGVRSTQRMAVRLLDWLKKRGFKVEYIAFSGGGGFHIPAVNPNEFVDGLRQSDYLKGMRKRYKDDLALCGVKVCEHSLLDIKRVFKIRGSLHAGNGLICSELSEEELRLPFREMVSKIKSINKKGAWKALNGLNDVHLSCITGELGGSVKAPAVLPFLDHRVLGVKDRHVLIVRTVQPEREAQRLIKKGFSDVHHYKRGDRDFLVCLTALQKEKASKVVSENVKNYSRNTLLPLNGLRYVETYKGSVTPHISKAHRNFLKTSEENIVIGNDKLIIKKNKQKR